MNVAWEKSPERRAQLAARFGIEDIRCHRWSGNPEIDQMERAYAEPHHRAASAHEELADVTAKGPARKPVVFTPWSRRPDRVQDLIMRPDPRTFLANARDYVDFFDLDYLRSNLPDRKPLPLKKAETRATCRTKVHIPPRSFGPSTSLGVLARSLGERRWHVQKRTFAMWCFPRRSAKAQALSPTLAATSLTGGLAKPFRTARVSPTPR